MECKKTILKEDKNFGLSNSLFISCMYEHTLYLSASIV